MAGGIRNPSNMFSAITNDNTQIEDDSFCHSCLNVGIRSILHKRMYGFNRKTKESELILDVDMENFRQCYNCGDIVPIYEVKHEPRVTDFVETTENPFDFNSEKIEVLNETPSQTLANKRNPTKRRMKQRKDLISSVKDPEIRRLLEEGAELEYEKEL
jgi:hypothetical protein